MAWAPDYVTLSEMKSYLRVGDSVDDAELALSIGAACRAIDDVTGRQFGKTDAVEERVYDVEWDRWHGLWFADIDDVQTTTGLIVAVEGSALAASDYELGPVNALKEGRPYEWIWVNDATSSDLTGRRSVEITATWGWTTVPTAIKRATQLQVHRLEHRKVSPHGVAGSPDFGTELRLLERLDPDVRTHVRPYWRKSKSRMFA